MSDPERNAKQEVPHESNDRLLRRLAALRFHTDGFSQRVACVGDSITYGDGRITMEDLSSLMRHWLGTAGQKQHILGIKRHTSII